MLNIKEIERLILTTYRSTIYKPFVKAIVDYKLLKDGDKVLVCISGGKDSLILAKLLQEIVRHDQFKVDLVFFAMDPGFKEGDRKLLEKNAKELMIPLIIGDSNFLSVALKLDPERPCYMCARMRRGFLYENAEKYGCNKIALAHTFDDVIETTLLNVIRVGEFKTMLPKLWSTNFKGLELIRPLYLVKEKDILNFMKKCEIVPIVKGCKFVEEKMYSDRQEAKKIIEKLKAFNKDIEKTLFSLGRNVNLNCVLGYKKGNTKHSFLDTYDKSKKNK